jgi:hypothetical protein
VILSHVGGNWTPVSTDNMGIPQNQNAVTIVKFLTRQVLIRDKS